MSETRELHGFYADQAATADHVLRKLHDAGPITDPKLRAALRWLSASLSPSAPRTAEIRAAIDAALAAIWKEP